MLVQAEPVSWDRFAARRLEQSRRAAQQHPVVGIVGADVPRGLVDTWGAVPLRVLPDGRPASHRATQLLGASTAPSVARILDAVLDGELAHLSGMIVSRETQDTLRLFYVLRMLARVGELPWPVHYLELLHSDRQSTIAYNEAMLRRCFNTIGEWMESDDRGVTADASVWGRVRRVYRLLDVTRSSHRASGADFVRTLAEVDAVSLNDAERLAASWSPQPRRGTEVILTGSRCWTSQFHEQVEAEGLRIVAEDQATGLLATSLRPAPSDLGSSESLFAEIAEGCARWGPAAATSSSTDRAQHVEDLVESYRVDAVHAAYDPADQAAPWDSAAQRDVCERRNIAWTQSTITPWASGASDHPRDDAKGD